MYKTGGSRLFVTEKNSGAVMPLTKADIAQAVADGTGLPLKRSAGIVETLIEIMKRAMESGEVVLVSGFGHNGRADQVRQSNWSIN